MKYRIGVIKTWSFELMTALKIAVSVYLIYTTLLFI